MNTFIARFPFALGGFACLFLTYFFSRSLFKDKKAAAMTVLALLFCIPFIILSRQARYYSLSALFSLGGLYGYYFMTQKKRFGVYLYVISSSLLFHTHYIYLGTLLATVVLHTLLFYREQWRKVYFWSFFILFINSPWIFWFLTMRYSEQYGTNLGDWNLFFSWLTSYLKDLRQYVFPLSILLIPFGLSLWYWIANNKEYPPWKDSKITKGVALIILFSMITLGTISIVGSGPFFRFCTPILPFLTMIIGLFLGWVMRIHFVLGIAILTVMVFLSPFHDFMYEITHDYDGPIEGIVKYLNEHAKKTDVVAITYGDLPVKFYTGLRVIGGLTGEGLSQAKNADWIIVRDHIICSKDRHVKNFLVNNVPWQKYNKIEINYPDTFFENRANPKEHLYRTASNVPLVVLFKKARN